MLKDATCRYQLRKPTELTLSVSPDVSDFHVLLLQIHLGDKALFPYFLRRCDLCTRSFIKSTILTEHTFSLQNISPLEIFGVNDQRLRQIEQGHPGVRFVARGDELKVRGEAEKVERLRQILETLFSEIQRKGHVSENRFQELIQPEPGRSKSANPLSPDDAVILHGANSTLIKA